MRAKATAVDRNLNNIQLIPLDAAEPTGKTSANGKPLVTTPSGLPPSGEKFTATKQRESFGHLVAAFFIAAAIVMLVARLFGALAVKIAQPRVMGEVVAGIALGPTILGWHRAGPPGRDLPDRHHPRVRDRGQPRADLLHVPGRPRARPEPAQGPASARPRRSRTRASRCR